MYWGSWSFSTGVRVYSISHWSWLFGLLFDLSDYVPDILQNLGNLDRDIRQFVAWFGYSEYNLNFMTFCNYYLILRVPDIMQIYRIRTWYSAVCLLSVAHQGFNCFLSLLFWVIWTRKVNSISHWSWLFGLLFDSSDIDYVPDILQNLGNLDRDIRQFVAWFGYILNNR